MREFVSPRKGFWRGLDYIGKRMRRLPDSPHRIALGFACGVFASFTPLFGLHFFIAAGLAWMVRGNVLAGVFGTIVGNPITCPLISGGSLWLGRWILGRQGGSDGAEEVLDATWDVVADAWSTIRGWFGQEAPMFDRFLDFLDQVFLPYLIGGLGPGLLCGAVCYVALGLIVDAYQARRRKKLVEAQKRRQALIDRELEAYASGTPREETMPDALVEPPTRLRLGVNIDQVARIRNGRGGSVPDPVRAAKVAEKAGAGGITAHLHEDRRHIADRDIERLMEALTLPLNFEMAATDEMLAIALRHRPHAVCIVPERREERTTEGGLEVAREENRLAHFIAPLAEAGCRVSLFVAAERAQIEAAARVGAPVVELHTGAYCESCVEGRRAERDAELRRLREMAALGHALGLEVHAGHGLTYDTVKPIAALPEVAELNIGHFLVGEAIFAGLPEAITQMRRLMNEARAETFGTGAA